MIVDQHYLEAEGRSSGDDAVAWLSGDLTGDLHSDHGLSDIAK
jgi:hypothetical protein